MCQPTPTFGQLAAHGVIQYHPFWWTFKEVAHLYGEIFKDETYEVLQKWPWSFGWCHEFVQGGPQKLLRNGLIISVTTPINCLKKWLPGVTPWRWALSALGEALSARSPATSRSPSRGDGLRTLSTASRRSGASSSRCRFLSQEVCLLAMWGTESLSGVPVFCGVLFYAFFFLVGAIRFIIRGLLEWLYNTVSDYVVLFVFLKVFYSKRSECWSLAFWLFWIIPTKEKGHLYHLKPAARVFYVGNFTTPLGRDAFLRLRRGSFRIMYSLGGLTDYLKIWIITYG